MLKKTIFCIFVVFCFFGGLYSCDPKSEARLQIWLDHITVPGEENVQFLTIETDPDREWTVTVDPSNDWCFVEPSSGMGNEMAIITCLENDSEYNRTATITTTLKNSNGTKASVYLTQSPLATLDVSGAIFTGSAASTLTFDVKTQAYWSAVITAGEDFCWVTSPSTGEGDGSFNVAFEAYNGTSSRNANLRITGVRQEINLTLTQGFSATRPPQDIPQRIELPEVKNTRWFVQHKYYAMEYDTAQRHTVWVAYVFNDAYNQKNVSRTNKWAFDVIIPPQFQSLNSTSQTFAAWGYDRGHLVASDDRVFSDSANWETFYYTNMSPQTGTAYGLNQGVWATLEALVRKWAQAADCDTLYVVTGGAINPGVEVIGTIPERNNVTIPKYYYKALVKRKGDDFTGIAWWLENKIYPTRAITTYENAMTIRELEQKTGINFFPNLKYVFPENPNLEEEVETVMNTSRWPL